MIFSCHSEGVEAKKKKKSTLSKTARKEGMSCFAYKMKFVLGAHLDGGRNSDLKTQKNCLFFSFARGLIL